MITQYGVLAFEARDASAPRILLITSRETKRWVIPRGNPIRGLAPWQSAAQEAFEEAGISGAVDPAPLGRYAYRKRLPNGVLVPTEVELFRLAVEAENEDWPEKGQRERRWFAPADAALAVDEEGLAELIRRFAANERSVKARP